VLAELRLLTSAQFDSKTLLSVVLAADARLIDKLRRDELLPLGSRIRLRLALEYASSEELNACLTHLLERAGNPTLMTEALKTTLCDHAAGNYRAMTTIAANLLTVAAERNLTQLDEKLYFEVFAPDTRKPRRVGARS
jgi:type II secretory pathway predicted ATPase ExeA